MKNFAHLKPDCSENIAAASRAAEHVAAVSNQLSGWIATIEENLILCQHSGLAAEKLDYCVRRAGEIRQGLNTLELGSFCGIAVKNTCQELWQKLP